MKRPDEIISQFLPGVSYRPVAIRIVVFDFASGGIATS